MSKLRDKIAEMKKRIAAKKTKLKAKLEEKLGKEKQDEIND